MTHFVCKVTLAKKFLFMSSLIWPCIYSFHEDSQCSMVLLVFFLDACGISSGMSEKFRILGQKTYSEGANSL